MSRSDQDRRAALIARARQLREGLDAPLHDQLASAYHARASAVVSTLGTGLPSDASARRRYRLDRLLTSRLFGFPIMLALLALVFYLTIAGANLPSQLLAKLFSWGEARLAELSAYLGAPAYPITGLAVHGIYRAVGWVVSVMLPPMAIFFPLFTLLEDLGYLPRVAFNLDALLRRAGAHGKQALTMTMGFGCNAAGVISTRIIDSPRERLIAILTNNFVPCNGRWPTLIMASSLFLAAGLPPVVGSLAALGAVIAMTLVGVAATLIASRVLSSTVLRGEPSTFQLELPPFRRPRVLQLLYTSFIDRTIFVLGRAVVVAAPAGALIWLLANLQVGQQSVYAYLSQALDPVGAFIGLDGVILLAFIVAIPANEIVVPTIIMGYLSLGKMVEIDDMARLQGLLSDHGWTATTAICLMLFSVLHYPCSTTSWTIWKETRSLRWTLLANLMPLGLALAVCALVANLLRAL